MAGVVEGLAPTERRLPPPECLAEGKDGCRLVMFCLCFSCGVVKEGGVVVSVTGGMWWLACGMGFGCLACGVGLFCVVCVLVRCGGWRVVCASGVKKV